MTEVPAQERRVAAMYLPPVVYIPILRAGGPDGPEIEMRSVGEGSTALMIYTALDRLARCCGPYQKWILYPLDKIDALHDQCPFDRVLIDVALPVELRHQVGEVDE